MHGKEGFFQRLCILLLLVLYGTKLIDAQEGNDSRALQFSNPVENDNVFCSSQRGCSNCTAAVKSDGTHCHWFLDNATGVGWCYAGLCNQFGFCGASACDATEGGKLPVLDIDVTAKPPNVLFEVENDDGSTTASLQVGKNSSIEIDGALLNHANTTVDVDTSTGAMSISNTESTTLLSEAENDDGTTSIINWTYSVSPSTANFGCSAHAIYCVPVSKFAHLPVFQHEYEEEGAVVLEAATKRAYKDDILEECLEINIFLPGLAHAIAEALVERHGEFRNTQNMAITVSGDGVDITMYGIGAVVSDVEGIDYLSGYFTVDLRVYLYKVTYKTPYDSVADSMEAAWTPINMSSVASASDKGHTQLLEDNFVYVKDQVGPDKEVIKDGHCNQEASQSFEPVSLAEYNGFGLHLRRSRTNLVPVTDSNNDVLYLTAHSARVKFQPVNAEFFPFQINILDISITTPASRFFLGKQADVYTFCIASPYTGFTYPIPSLPNNGELSMIPTIESVSVSPWFNKGTDHMHLDSTAFSTVEEDLSEKYHQAANFRIVYSDKSVLNSWMTLFPFLFTAFTTQLQWLVTKPDSCDATSMITSVLLIQSLVSSQSAFTGYHSVATEVIYMTYAITGVYISAVAFMTFINLSKESGRRHRLAEHQFEIYRYFRLVGLLITFLYIPIIAITDDEKTGEQHHVLWLWPFVGFIILSILFCRIVLDIRHGVQGQIEAKKKAQDFRKSTARLTQQKMTNYSISDVHFWIAHSKKVAAACPFFSKEDLHSIANKFNDAKIDGNSLFRVASDHKTLVQFVGLPIGQAINFSDAFNLIMDGNIIKSNDKMDDLEGTSRTTVKVNKLMMAGGGIDEYAPEQP